MENNSPFGRRDIFQRQETCLIGGIIGDMAGSIIEFIDEIQVLKQKNISDLATDADKQRFPAFTDDTQMTLFTLEGLVRASLRWYDRGVSDPVGVVRHALIRWLSTQGVTPNEWYDNETGLIADTRLHFRAAPGLTCLESLKSSRPDMPFAKNNSKGCGTIMRVAPVGLFCARDRVAEMAQKTSSLTHGHPTAQVAASFWAELLADVLAGMELYSAVNSLVNKYQYIDNSEETIKSIQKALALPKSGGISEVASLGGGWVAEECLAIALYAGLCANEDVRKTSDRETAFYNGLQCATLHPGDSDSTGSVAGNLLGLLFPEGVGRFDGLRSISYAKGIIERLVTSNELIRKGDREAAVKLGQLRPN